MSMAESRKRETLLTARGTLLSSCAYKPSDRTLAARQGMGARDSWSLGYATAVPGLSVQVVAAAAEVVVDAAFVELCAWVPASAS